jgi:hypothetical protein
MTNVQKWFVLICLLAGCIIGTLVAQQQFSGGQTVTIGGSLPTGSNTIGKVDILGNSGATLDSAAGTSNGQAITIQGNSSGVSVPVTATLAASQSVGLNAGTNLIGKTYPYTGCGTTQVESGSPVGFAAMPTSATSIESSTTCVLTLVVTNTSAATSYTYYFTDAQSTAIPVIGSSANPVTILAGERDEYTFPNGAKFNSGIKAAASNSAVSYYLLGIQ